MPTIKKKGIPLFFLALLAVSFFVSLGNCAVVFSDNFDDGNYTGWTASGSPTCVTTYSHSASYSVYCNAAEYIVRGFTAGTKHYARVYVYFDTLPGTGGRSVGVLGILDVAGTYFAIAAVTDNVWNLQTAEGGASTYTASDLSVTADTWYCVEVLRDVGADHAELWVNGVSEASRDFTITNNNALTTIGSGVNVGSPTNDLYVDCYVLDNANYIGTEATAYSYTLSQTIALTSSLETQKALTKTLTETVILSDGSTVTKTKTVSNTETVTTETTFSDQKAVTSTTMEYVNLTSSLESTKSVSETLIEAAETANLESTLTTSKSIFASIAETINLNSLMEATKHIGATLVELAETLNLTGVLESISSALSSDEWFAAGAIIALVVVCPFLALFVLRRRLN